MITVNSPQFPSTSILLLSLIIGPSLKNLVCLFLQNNARSHMHAQMPYQMQSIDLVYAIFIYKALTFNTPVQNRSHC